MKLRHPLIPKLGGLAAATIVRSWMNTLDWKVAFYDPSVDPLDPACREQMLYLFWHEYILAPLAMRGNANLAMLLSRHQDAEIIDRAALHLGFETIRGSTNRGGVAALRAMLRTGRKRHLTIVPDGPRGPRRQMALGPIYLASKIGLPLVLLGVGHDHPWRARSWDRFAVPRMFSRGRAIVSPPLRLPAHLDRDGLEHYRLQTERLLNRLTTEAEAWAEAGTRKLEEQRVLRRRGELRGGRADGGHRLLGPHLVGSASGDDDAEPV